MYVSIRIFHSHYNINAVHNKQINANNVNQNFPTE